MLAHRNEPPPQLPDGIPAGLRDLVMALLDKDPAKRPTDGRAISAQADRFNQPTVAVPVLTDPYPSAPPPPVASNGPATGVLDVPPRLRRGDVRVRVRRHRGCRGVARCRTRRSDRRGQHARRESQGRDDAAEDDCRSCTWRWPRSSPTPAPAARRITPRRRPSPPTGTPRRLGTRSTTPRLAFGQLRSGAGLLFDLGHPVAVKSLKLRLAVTGVALQVHAGDAVGSLLSSPAVGSSTSAPGVLALRPTRHGPLLAGVVHQAGPRRRCLSRRRGRGTFARSR